MNFIDNYYKNIIKYDLLNRFRYKSIKKLPKLKKIVLNCGCKNSDLKQIVSSLTALELIGAQKGLLTFAKKSNISLKIRKGNPIGCKILLNKIIMYQFLEKLILQVISNLPSFSVKNFNSASITLKNPLIFSELEQQYYFFKNVSKIDITIVSDSTSFSEFVFLLRSFKLPVL